MALTSRVKRAIERHAARLGEELVAIAAAIAKAPEGLISLVPTGSGARAFALAGGYVLGREDSASLTTPSVRRRVSLGLENGLEVEAVLGGFGMNLHVRYPDLPPQVWAYLRELSLTGDNVIEADIGIRSPFQHGEAVLEVPEFRTGVFKVCLETPGTSQGSPGLPGMILILEAGQE